MLLVTLEDVLEHLVSEQSMFLLNMKNLAHFLPYPARIVLITRIIQIASLTSHVEGG